MAAVDSPASLPDALDQMVDYLVDTPAGRVGVLDGCRRDPSGRPVALLVARGWFGRRRLDIPTEELVQVDHGAGRLVLTQGAAPSGPTDLLQRIPGLAAEGADGSAGYGPVLCGIDGDLASLAGVVSVAAQLSQRLATPLVLVQDGPEGDACGNGILTAAMISEAALGADVRRLVGDAIADGGLEGVASRERASFLVVADPASLGRAGGAPGQVPDSPCPVVIVPAAVPASGHAPGSLRPVDPATVNAAASE